MARSVGREGQGYFASDLCFSLSLSSPIPLYERYRSKNLERCLSRVRKPSKMNSVVDFKLFRQTGRCFTVNLSFFTIFVTCYDDFINTGNGVHDDQWPRFSILTKFHNCPFSILVAVQQFFERFRSRSAHPRSRFVFEVWKNLVSEVFWGMKN